MNIIIKQPVITEKTTLLAEQKNQYTFEVTLDADKEAAKAQIEQLYSVEVTNVSSHTRLGKKVRFGKYRSRETYRRNRKFMIFSLKEGQSIDVFTQA